MGGQKVEIIWGIYTFDTASSKEAGRVVKREIEFYNLDVILSVGYRVNSKQGTQFRIGASLKDLGKKLFGFSKMEIGADVILRILSA